MRVISYCDLRVWQQGMMLAELCYRLAARLPRSEEFGLKSQLRRAAASIPANITETHLHLAVRVGLLTPADIAPALECADMIGRMLWRLRQRLEARPRGKNLRVRILPPSAEP